MVAVDIEVTPYTGSLLSLDLLSGQQTILLNAFGTTTIARLSDGDGTLGGADTGISTLNGAAITFIGSGTVQPGVRLAFLTVPLGQAVPVVVFAAGGQTYFHFPDGGPNLIGAIAMVVNVSPVAYPVFEPACLGAGTLIATPGGEVAVEHIRPGDRVLDVDGQAHPVIWAGGQQRALPVALLPGLANWLPVVIPADCFGPGRPHREVRLSQQHRIMVEGAGVELHFGTPRALLPAVALLGDRVRLDRACTRIAYHHILCARHVVLMAAGLPVESLQPGGAGLTDDARRAWDETAELIPDAASLDTAGGCAALPILRAGPGRVLRPG